VIADIFGDIGLLICYGDKVKLKLCRKHVASRHQGNVLRSIG